MSCGCAWALGQISYRRSMVARYTRALSGELAVDAVVIVVLRGGDRNATVRLKRGDQPTKSD